MQGPALESQFKCCFSVEKSKMITCFTALLVEFVAVAQIVYPLHDLYPDAKCANELKSWVNDQVRLGHKRGEKFKDNSYPECDPSNGEYKSMQCKIGSHVDEDYCKCVYPDNNEPILIYADNDRIKLQELSRVNFPVMFAGRNFKCEWFHPVINTERYRRWKTLNSNVPWQIGIFCNPTFTENNRCIDKKTKQCIDMNQCEKSTEKCNCDTSCTSQGKRPKCKSYESARANYISTIKKSSENHKRRSKRLSKGQ